MADLYENLLKATSNIDDITTEKYGVITKLDGLYCSVKETDNDLEHNNVPIINGANLSVGDKVIIGFLNNCIYDVVCYGALDKTVHDDTKQDKLISGSNIKTVNNESLLGSGNITIQGGSNVDIVTSWETTPSDTKVASEKLTKDTLDTKQATLVSGTNIKTINSTSLLGSGDIQITGGSGGSCVTDFYIDSNTDEWVIETSACSQGEVVTSWSSTLSDEKVPSEKLVKGYVDDLVGDAILFINGSGT